MIKYAKIINNETKACMVGLGDDVEFYKSEGLTEMDVEEAYNGGWYLTGYAPSTTKEEQEKNREQAYENEVDPITCHIQRLLDEEQTEEVIAEIEALKQERSEKVEEIKRRFPYPVGE